ncbi:hypothetical protein [Streptomyces phage phiSAJS1]|uniref:MazG-like pyrophosphatase n=1 Tax=Streptomyces phage phiSAJS1 TaxID=1755682 RepID=UPI00071F36F1|nr:MazG-like pyrophosphatase [Streptomyces phage phiSAJS1]ALO79370.1 hypothetical protein [Streptomyces phage phiSAJS1]
MFFADYEAEAAQTAVYPDAGTASDSALAYVVLGLTGEAGEVANKVKKILRGDGFSWENRDALISELGDVLWYVAALARELQVPLDNVARINLRKLEARADNGTIKGNGDNR